MKLFVLLFCFNPTPDLQAIQNEMSKINGISEQFVENINAMVDEYHGNELVNTFLRDFVSKNNFETNIQRLLENVD